MKRLYVICGILAFALSSLAQKHPYVKIQPSIMFATRGDKGILPSGNIGTGQNIGKGIQAGIDFGLFKFDQKSKPVKTVGLQVGFGSLTEKKVSPVLFIGGYYPIYNNDVNSTTESGTTRTYFTNSSAGVFQLKIDGGLLIPVRSKKIMVGAGFSQLSLRSKSSTMVASPTSVDKTYSKQILNYKFYTATVMFIL